MKCYSNAGGGLWVRSGSLEVAWDIRMIQKTQGIKKINTMFLSGMRNGQEELL